MRALGIVITGLLVSLAFTGTASAVKVDQPSNPAPAWFTDGFKKRVPSRSTEG